MTAFVQAFFRTSTAETETRTETDVFTVVALFCGAGLVVSVICAAYGLDLSPGFF
jgi:hypothetical protein